MRRATLLALVAFLCAEALWAWSLRGIYQAELRLALDHHQADLDASLRSLVDGYGHTVDVVTRTTIDRPEVRALLAEAAGADPEQARHLRGRLYRLLYPTYSILRDHDLRDLQFRAPNGHSFLRFHRPDLFDDAIAADRPMLRAVLDRGEPGQAFEMGRVHPGYHFAYPLYEGAGSGRRLIGVADYGVSFAAIRRFLQKSGEPHGVASRFILRAACWTWSATPAPGPCFARAPSTPTSSSRTQKSSLSDTEPSLSLPPWVDTLERQLSQDARVQGAIAAGTPHTTLACTSLENCYAVALLPVLDSTQRVAGFLNAYNPVPGIVDTRISLLLAFFVGSLMILAAGVTLRRVLAANQRLRSISEHMAEGLYVIDSAGLTLYTNIAAYELLGYASHELIGQLAHEVIHPSDPDQAGPTESSPLRHYADRGEVYRSDQEIFRRKDGRLLPVSLISSPMREEGEVTGTVALFRDISAEYEARMRLRQAEIAFSHLAEAVVVTDAEGRIQVVNPAFTQITGYAEEEVLGKNPRILASGRHDRAFYERMWHAIRKLGYWEGEVWNRRKNGEIYPETLKITAVRDAEKRIVGFVSVFSDIAEFRAKEERLRHLAYRDQLTGLYNRNAFMQIFEHALHRARDRGTRLALLYLDIDRFKRINDTLGHVIGDALLQRSPSASAPPCARRTRRPDWAATSSSSSSRTSTNRRPRRGSRTPARAHPRPAGGRRQAAPCHLEHRDLRLPGGRRQPDDTAQERRRRHVPGQAKRPGRLSLLHRRHGQGGRSPLRAGDRAAPGPRDGPVAIGVPAQGRAGRRAGDRGRGPGALATPARRAVAAGPLPLVAAENNLMQPLTHWVVAEASRQCARWRAEDLAVGRIACNLDARIYHPAALETMLLETVAAAGITPADIEFEILETGMLKETLAQGLWQRLVAHGFDLSIDDFGTGESSLARIKELPVPTLKIDRGFVRDLETDQGDRSIVHTVIAMTRTLGKQALAEGVETDAQVRFLIEAGCDAIQGYWFSPPLPPEAIPDLIRSDLCRDKLWGLAREEAPARRTAVRRAQT